jgi:hypothetical protein
MDIVEKLRDTGDHARFEPSLYHEAADEIERLRDRERTLSGYLRGALNVIEGMVACDTTEARAALGEEK